TTGAFLPLPADRYVPTPELLEYLRLTFPVCAVPGCTRPTSWASQIDHIQEYHHTHPETGGTTEIPNLHPLCWRHHQMKTAGLLDPIKESITHPTTPTNTQFEPGTTTWTTRNSPPRHTLGLARKSLTVDQAAWA